ncbi:hypothetical protein [Paenibacillus thermotolerans]|uniref:hypothetical protein n=1 Tax=Paenibacillus thermotolerans TaxID=3027807 RepID=UPI002367AB01|nr:MULTISPECIES: hypothetical protein [unclassified Paenibacillus]
MNDRERMHEPTTAATIDQALLRLKSMNVRLSPARLAILEELWSRSGTGRSRPTVAENKRTRPALPADDRHDRPQRGACLRSSRTVSAIMRH